MSAITAQLPKYEEHDWNSYLIETNSEAAPACNFKQSLIPPKNEFNIGDKLESIDPRNRDAWCIGTVIDKAGPRIRIRLDGTDDRNDFWKLVDSSDIRIYGKTVKLGGQIVPPLGFQQTSTRWAKYFEKNVKNGPFADESCFKPQPAKPEKNLFQKGQKLEAVDPKHTQVICPATVHSLIPGDHRIILSLDGWSSSNNFKIDYSSRDIFPVGWCKSAGIRLARVGGHPPSRTSNKTLPTKKEHRELNDVKKEPLIVTVYWNYDGDNCGMLLNSQRFHSFMPSIFGPNECNSVLKTIFDSCVKCSFQPTSLINRIRDLFSLSDEKKKDSSIQIELENGTFVNIPSIETKDEFWDVIRIFQNGILAGVDLFISTPPSLPPIVNENKTEQPSISSYPIKRKSIEFNLDNKTFLTNGKASKTNSNEKSVYDTEFPLENHNSENDFVDISSDGIIRRPERFTPSDVAKFIRKIDPSFENLACRFLQEEIDGKALLLLTTDTLMRHLGLKLGPSLKIIHHIEKLKKRK